MELTKELLVERRAQLVADLHALEGAVQQVDWSLAVLEEGERSPSSANDSLAGNPAQIGEED